MGDGELALGGEVPQGDLAVAVGERRGGAVGGEGDGGVVVVADDEAGEGLAGGAVDEDGDAVGASGQEQGAVGGEGEVLDEPMWAVFFVGARRAALVAELLDAAGLPARAQEVFRVLIAARHLQLEARAASGQVEELERAVTTERERGGTGGDRQRDAVDRRDLEVGEDAPAGDVPAA